MATLPPSRDPKPSRPAVRARLMLQLDDAMSAVDLELFAAEKSGDRSVMITCLLERSELWLRYARLLTSAGQDALGATLSAQRDRTTALNLQAEAGQ